MNVRSVQGGAKILEDMIELWSLRVGDFSNQFFQIRKDSTEKAREEIGFWPNWRNCRKCTHCKKCTDWEKCKDCEKCTGGGECTDWMDCLEDDAIDVSERVMSEKFINLPSGINEEKNCRSLPRVEGEESVTLEMLRGDPLAASKEAPRGISKELTGQKLPPCKRENATCHLQNESLKFVSIPSVFPTWGERGIRGIGVDLFGENGEFCEKGELGQKEFGKKGESSKKGEFSKNGEFSANGEFSSWLLWERREVRRPTNLVGKWDEIGRAHV